MQGPQENHLGLSVGTGQGHSQAATAEASEGHRALTVTVVGPREGRDVSPEDMCDGRFPGVLVTPVGGPQGCWGMLKSEGPSLALPTLHASEQSELTLEWAH